MAKHLVLIVHSYLPTKCYKNIKKELESFNRYFLTKTNIDNNMRVDIFENFASYPANKFSCREAASEHKSLKLTQKKRCKPFNLINDLLTK
jgi:hypothetical protein